ncbi:ATP-binding response regulator [Thiothrix subterranea]|uniref:histidine kinase n=2 Tax=Thiothrix subterranea TaxID=2735563 RepID=A0AA51MQ99_9GAMM|nr:hybrid sensor histidine kinase/response regulator [Thiothrix subterranea]MDQ5768827.1 hybrid sensor histidine kinase/response regulator [Thiothrix subterranea]WML86492.1 hybrid sensor histidine kinase/response regulator [Thiothrix subterranea]
MTTPHNPVLHLEQVKLLYRNLKVAIPGNLFVLVGIMWVAWADAGKLEGLLWVGVLLLLLWRYVDGVQFQRALQQSALDPRYWEKRFSLAMFLMGLLWALIFLSLFDVNKPDVALFVLYFYGGLIASASATSAPRFLAFVFYVTPMTVLLMVRMLQVGEPLYTMMALAFLVFIVASSTVCLTYSRIIHESICLRFENMALITRLEAEKALAEKNQQIAEQAVFAKDKFLAAASHDLRQPLHAQGLYLDAIETYVHPKGVAHLQALRRTNDALSNLFNSLLDVSRLNAGIVEVQLNHARLFEIVQPLHEEFKTHAAEKNLSLLLDCPHLTVFTDPLLLGRILRNLLANAVRYTQQGSITLTCRATAHDTVRIAVQDTGIGIPATEQANIFDEYYQLDNPERDRSKGLGLGLAIVKKLADLLSLTLTCESRVSSGSTFALDVPQGDASLLYQAPPVVSAVSVAGVHVLVIDDEREILHSMAYLLKSWGCLAITAESASEALEKIAQTGLQPELIMADYRLREGKTGAEAITAVRHYCQRAIPAMLITGDTSEERLREATASGLYLLHKPVAPSRLRTVMTQLLKQAAFG